VWAMEAAHRHASLNPQIALKSMFYRDLRQLRGT
jgi:hypothetical protein